MADTIITKNTATMRPDDVVQDRQVLSMKNKMMKHLRWSSMLSSLSKMATFVAGVMIPVALTLIVPLIKDVTTLSGALAAISGSGLGVGFLGMAVAATVLAIGTDYVASRIWQAGNFDGLEVNAQSTAHHLVNEIMDNNLCLTEQKAAPCRADGKSWTQFVDAQRNQVQQTQTR